MMRLLRDLVGETLSERYKLVGRIAGGGMGEVYRGHDLLLDRAVAVKVLQPSLANDPGLVARFKNEARAAARLNHPNVVLVHDWGSQDERTYYMVMEYVAGTDLRDLLVGRGPFDPSLAVEVSIAICDALQAAHLTGLVHRDVKPENVLIARDGTVKVADFGIAAVTDAERTMPGGGILGTFRYLSPEQAAGGEATTLSDVWAAGAVLFELLTGSAPHGGAGAEFLHRRSTEPPVAPSSLEPGVPAELDDIVAKACSVDPAARFRSAADLAGALRDLAPSLPKRRKEVADLMGDVTGEIHLPAMEPTSFESRRSQRRGLRPARLALVAGLALLLLVAGAKVVPALLGPHEVDVPVVTGMTLARATEAAEETGLEIAVVQRRRDADVAEGSVISQTPAGGKLLEGKTVKLVVSKGPPLVKLPSLAGTPLAEAKKKLSDLGLVPGDVTRSFSTEQEAGRVIGVGGDLQGKIEQGTEVSLVVSKGPRSVTVPDVGGKKAPKAQAILEDAGFEVALIDVYSDDVPEGRVVSTTPAGGEDADEASQVQMSVSLGPEFHKVRMPDVRGMSVGDAKAKLQGLGLRVKVRQSCSGSTVVETSPIAGTQVRENDEVVLFVC